MGSVLASDKPSFEMETLVSALEAEPALRNSLDVVGCLVLAEAPEGLKGADSAFLASFASVSTDMPLVLQGLLELQAEEAPLGCLQLK